MFLDHTKWSCLALAQMAPLEAGLGPAAAGAPVSPSARRSEPVPRAPAGSPGLGRAAWSAARSAPRPRSLPGCSGSGTTFSAVLPRPSRHRTGPRLRPARPAARSSGPGCSAARASPGPAAPRASRSVRRRPAAARTVPGRAAPGGSGPGSRERGGEEVGAGSSAGWRPGLPPAHLPPLAGPAPPVRPPLPPSRAAVGPPAPGALGQRAQT